MSNFEKKFGRYAIKNLTTLLIICYVVGYILNFAPDGFNVLGYLTLDPYMILHGQIWRLFTWLLVPPTDSNIFFILIMLYFYYSIGTTMEKVWGDYKYNVYIFTGLLLMIIAAFLAYGFLSFEARGSVTDAGIAEISANMSYFFSTYYVNMSILLAFAATFPDNVVLFMFIIPLKMKWLGIIYGVWLAFEAVTAIFSSFFYAKIAAFPIAASLLTFGIFWITSGRFMHLRPREIKRRSEFKRSVKMTPPGITRHKCAVCGKTEEDDTNLVFRFCSKCNGNYEYCSEHLFTHEHVK